MSSAYPISTTSQQRNLVRATTLATLAMIAVVLAIAIAFAISRARSDSSSPAGAGFWHTSGTRVLDTNNRMVRIAGVTWYGMETTYWVPAGLDYQPYTKIMNTVKSLGYNAIRLPYSNELVETNPVVTQRVKANPGFLGMHAMNVLDAIVNYAHRIKLKIILDNHVSGAEKPLHVNDLTEPLWYTPQYPESAWIKDWQTLARRYRHNDAVIGFDLRNEPHTNGPGPWNLHTYSSQGATWGLAGKVRNPATDWRLAAEKAGNAALAINPHLLMFVEGLQLYPDAAGPGGVTSYWWGSILKPVRQYPIQFKVKHQLIYSPHDWGPRKYAMSWFHGMTYRSMQRVWHDNWSFLLDNPNASYAAPIWIGEFGTCTTLDTCVNKQLSGNQATWLHLLLRYLKEHPEVGWSFYALNGTNANNSLADNGLLNGDWSKVSNPALQRNLAGVQAVN
jgi:endoglucanase